MLKLHIAGNQDALTATVDTAWPSDVTWYDLEDPSGEEVAAVQRVTGLHLPTGDAVRGISLPQRGHHYAQSIGLQMILWRADRNNPGRVPTALVADATCLVTLHVGAASVIDTAAAQVRQNRVGDGATALAILMEAVTNEATEQMQQIANEVGDLSNHIFVDRRLHERELQRLMLLVGTLESRLARYRTSLLGIARMVAFVARQPPAWIAKPILERLQLVEDDLVALDTFDDQLTGKLQFLLDAILGFISNAQNNVMKVLTVASVVTIPPFLLASIWGMNFSDMPELAPRWAYPVALVFMAMTVATALWWFRRRGWIGTRRPPRRH